VKRVLVGVAVAVAAMLVTAPPALACSCVEDPDAKETLHGFDAAATARLVDVKEDDNPQSGDVKLVYRVLRVYKGANLSNGEEFVIKDDRFNSCALPSDKGRRYGLRLSRFQGRLDQSSCTLLSPKGLRRAAERSGNARSAGTGCGTQS
jgi:hypothetical protein